MSLLQLQLRVDVLERLLMLLNCVFSNSNLTIQHHFSDIYVCSRCVIFAMSLLNCLISKDILYPFQVTGLSLRARCHGFSPICYKHDPSASCIGNKNGTKRNSPSTCTKVYTPQLGEILMYQPFWSGIGNWGKFQI